MDFPSKAALRDKKRQAEEEVRERDAAMLEAAEKEAFEPIAYRIDEVVEAIVLYAEGNRGYGPRTALRDAITELVKSIK